MDQFSFNPHNNILNDSEILSETFPYLISKTLFKDLNSSSQDYWNLLYPPVKMEGIMFSDILLYVCVSLTSLATAFVASKTLLSYHQHFRYVFRLLKIHLEDWAMFWLTFGWLMLVNQPYGIAVCYRWAMSFYIRVKYGKLGNIATGLDSAGSLDHPNSRQIIKSLMVLKGKCNLEELKKRVLATACKQDKETGELAHPKFHQYLDTCGGFYCWRPSNFDIDYHVKFVEGLDEESESIGETELMELISKYSNKAFQEKRALWEILVVPKVHYKSEEENREEKFAIIVRISHGIGDGFSFLKLVMRDMAGADEEEYSPPSKPSRSSWLRKICVFCYLFFKSPRAFYRDRVMGDVNPMHNPEIKLTGEKVHIWSDPMDIEWLKSLKTELKCGMNVMLLSTLSSACKKYMKSQFGLNEPQIPNHITTIIPIPAPNHPNNKLVNKFSIIMLPLDMKKTNCLDRCREIERQNKIKSTSPDGYLNLFLMDLVACFPISWTKFLLVNRQCTTVISNLPGPKRPITIWGYPLEDTMFWLPNVGTSGVSVSYLSYGNKLRIGLAVDTGVVTNGQEGAEQLMTWMLQELQNLAAAVNLSHDEMYIKTCAIDHTKTDKDSEVASEDYGYGHSDISSTSDSSISYDTEEDEDMLELSIKFDKEIVGFKNLKGSNKLYDNFSSSERDNIDQRFLISQSQSVTNFNKTDSSNVNSSSYKRNCLNASR